MDGLIPLVTASRTGDAEAYRRPVRRLEEMVFGCVSQFGGRSLAEDATQKSLVEAFAHIAYASARLTRLAQASNCRTRNRLF